MKWATPAEGKLAKSSQRSCPLNHASPHSPSHLTFSSFHAQDKCSDYPAGQWRLQWERGKTKLAGIDQIKKKTRFSERVSAKLVIRNKKLILSFGFFVRPPSSIWKRKSLTFPSFDLEINIKFLIEIILIKWEHRFQAKGLRQLNILSSHNLFIIKLLYTHTHITTDI